MILPFATTENVLHEIVHVRLEKHSLRWRRNRKLARQTVVLSLPFEPALPDGTVMCIRKKPTLVVVDF
jgi:urease accessory protein UreE